MHAIVHAANVQDRDGGVWLMAVLFARYPFLVKLYADGGYQGPQFRRAIKKILRRVNLEIVKRSDQAKGFVVLPKRWIVLPRTILPDSASSGRRWSLASLCPGPSGTRAPWPS
jgi:hypothetical protein